MTHFSVAVISRKPEDVEDLLASFDENLEVEPYLCRTKEKLLEEERKSNSNFLDFILKNIDQYKEQFDKYCDCENWDDDKVFENYLYKTYTCPLEKLKEVGYFDEDGNEYNIENPNSKWDYYRVVGGVPTKGGSKNFALVKNVQFYQENPENNKELSEYWDSIFLDREWTEEENNKFGFLRPKKSYMEERYGTKENFIKESNTFRTYAILTPDGKWHEPGEVGWFGTSSATAEDEKDFQDKYFEILKDYQDCYFTLVNCHI